MEEPVGTSVERCPARVDPRRAFAAAASIYSVIVAVQVIAPLVVTPYLTRTLSLSAYGAITLAVLLARVLAVVLDAGFPLAVSRSYFKAAEDDEHARSLVFHVLCVIAGASTGVAALALVVAPLYRDVISVELVLLGVLAASLLAAFEVDQSLMRSRGQTRQFATSAAISVLASQLLGVVGVHLRGDALGFVMGFVLGTGLGAAHSLIVVRPLPSRAWKRAGRTALRSTLPVALPSAVYGTTLMLLTYIDRFVLSGFHGTEATGRYQLAYTVGGLTVAAMGALNLAWGPEVFRTLQSGPTFLRRTTTDLALVMLMIVAIGVWLAPVGVAFLVPADYDRDGITAAACLVMPLGALQVVHYACSHVLTWAGRLGVLVPAAATVAVLQLVGNLLVDRAHPLLGPPVVTTMSFVCLAAILVTLAARRRLTTPDLAAYLAIAMSLCLGVAGAWASFAGASLLHRAAAPAVALLTGAAIHVARTRLRRRLAHQPSG